MPKLYGFFKYIGDMFEPELFGALNGVKLRSASGGQLKNCGRLK